MIWQFEEFELDAGQFELRREGEQVAVEPQVFDVLSHLVKGRDRVVPKEELLDAVWGDRFVSESALTSRIKAARQAVGDSGTAQRVIRTAHGRGYQFVAPVRERPSPSAAETPGPDLTQDIRFCVTADGVRLGYASVGDGPVLVRAAHWMTHLDYDFKSRVWRHWLEGLSQGRTLIRYDERGCGMSDQQTDDFSFEAWVNDLATVVDAAELSEFDLLGVSQGGPVAISYAVEHPERVRRLVLYGTYSRGRLARAPSEADRREALLQQEMATLGWGRADDTFRQFFAAQFMPEGDREIWSEFSQLQRRTISARNAGLFMEAFSRIDVAEMAGQVTVPTLIFHGRDDLRVPFEQGMELAALIPGSRLVPLESKNHLLLENEPAFGVFLEEMGRFLDET